MSRLYALPRQQHDTRIEFEYALTSTDGTLRDHGVATAAALPKADQCFLVAPSGAVSWHFAQVPKLHKGVAEKKLQAVLASVLEERLLDDESGLHFVSHPKLRSDAGWWIAVCRKSLLQNWILDLRTAGLAIVDVLPQTAPSMRAIVHVSGTPDRAIASLCDEHGAIDLPVEMVAKLQPNARFSAASAEPSVSSVAEQKLGQQVPIVQAHEWLVRCAQRATRESLSLATGDFDLGGSSRLLHNLTGALEAFWVSPVHKPLRWGLIGVLAVHLVGLNAVAWKEHRAVTNKRAEMNALLTATFPQVKLVVDAPVQMQAEMSRLRQSQGQLSDRDFESMYGRFLKVAALPSAPAAIEYSATELQLRGLELTAAQLDTLIPRLRLEGIAARGDAQALTLIHQDGSRSGR